jgi:WD40 repeat protein
MLDGSDTGEVNALAITKEGEHFVSGGEDKKIKLWDYDEGISYYQGLGHSGNITRVRIFICYINIHYRSPFLQIKDS